MIKILFKQFRTVSFVVLGALVLFSTKLNASGIPMDQLRGLMRLFKMQARERFF
jgi:hypothetical protein